MEVSSEAEARVVELMARPSARVVVEVIRRYFRATVENVERIPRSGGALIVGNHALFGIDSFVLVPLLLKETGRYVRFIADRNVWQREPFASFFQLVAAVPGEHEVAGRLLTSGQLLGVYPGGIHDSFKTSRERGRLQWGNRSGFARLAMRAGVPIIPVAGLGIDDAWRVLGRERWIGRTLFGSERYDIPIPVGVWGTPLPRRARFRFVVAPPVDTRGNPDDPVDVERVRAGAQQALEQILDGRA
ncbi:MAG: lysophospholipid acyltransferase family protein [Myxococcota bacterium]